MKKIFSIITFCLISFSIASAQNVAGLHQKEYNVDKSGLAVDGYDLVAYFTANKATEGRSDLSYQFEGLTYRFSTAQNLALFKAAPEKYLPQYGGWCAYAMGANGEKVNIDPGTFEIRDGKLYLFYNKYFNNTKKSWDKNEPALKLKADANWEKIISNHKAA